MFELLVGLFTSELNRAIKRRTNLAAFLLVAGILFLFALGFLLVALRDWIETVYMTRFANVYVAGGLFVVSLGLGIVGLRFYKRRQPASIVPIASAVAAPVLAKSTVKAMSSPVIVIGSVIILSLWIGRYIKRSS